MNRWAIDSEMVFRLCGAVLLAATFGPEPADANQFVRLDYSINLDGRSRDRVFIEVFDDKPISRDNFMAYVNGDKYDGMFMHRLSKDFVMQGGAFYPGWVAEPTLTFPWSLRSDVAVQVDLDGNPATPNPQIMNEYSVGQARSNVRGTLGMARLGSQPNSATSQWFVNYVNNSFLDSVDGGFTVFGEVRGDGMSYLDSLNVRQTAQEPNGVVIQNLNPDANDNGVRESGVFSNPGSAQDAVPLWKGQKEGLVIVEDAQRVDYFGGTGSSTALNVPAGGLTLSGRPTFFDTGASITGSGMLTVAADAALGLREGISLSQSVLNQGTIEPGLRIGSVKVQSYHQAASGILAIDLGGTAAESQYDQVFVNGAVQLDGTLRVSLLNGFLPALGNSFTVLSAGGIAGDFANYELPQLDEALSWQVSKSLDAVTLTVVAVPEPGLFGMTALALLLTVNVRQRV